MIFLSVYEDRLLFFDCLLKMDYCFLAVFEE